MDCQSRKSGTRAGAELEGGSNSRAGPELGSGTWDLHEDLHEVAELSAMTVGECTPAKVVLLFDDESP